MHTAGAILGSSAGHRVTADSVASPPTRNVAVTALETVDTFLNHMFNGDIEKSMALVAHDALFIGARPTQASSNPIFGTRSGPQGAREFFAAFVSVLKPGDFAVQGRFSDGEHVALYGTLCHTVIATGHAFASDWALICRVREGRLTLYHFYEDTDALMTAMERPAVDH